MNRNRHSRTREDRPVDGELSVRARDHLSLSIRADSATVWRPVSFDEKSFSVDVIAATEQPVRVFDMERFEVVNEVLLMSGLELPDSGRVPLLDSHTRWSVKDVLGSVGGFKPARINGSGNVLEARVTFAATADGRAAAELVRDGHLTDVSVGYQTKLSSWIPDGETAEIQGVEYRGPLRVTQKWRLFELSITPIGADEQAKTRAATDIGKPKGGEKMNKKLREALMARGLSPDATDQEAWNFLAGLDETARRSLMVVSDVSNPGSGTSTAPSTAGAPPPDVDEIRSAAQREERERITTIRDACQLAHVDALADELIRTGVQLDAARTAIFAEMAKQSRPAGPHIEGGPDETEKYRAAAIDGLAMRTGVTIEKPAPGATDFLSAGLRRLAEQCLRRAGARTDRMSDMDLAKRALMANSTSDFPYILASVANKVLRAAYDEYPSTFERWCTIGSASDFRTMSRVQLSEAPDLELISEGGEYRESPWSEERETFAVQKYGKVFSVTLEAIVNDDLGALTRVPRAFGAAASRRVNASVYALLTANAAMADGTALFHANHSNLASSGAAPSVSTISAGRAAMRTQTGPGGAVLNIIPRYILIPAALETATEVILRSAAYPDSTGNAGTYNPLQGQMEPVVDAHLDASSATAWYLAAGQSLGAVEVAFLDGQRAPYLEEREGFTIDGREYKVRIVFGCKVLDWRGLYKNAGA